MRLPMVVIAAYFVAAPTLALAQDRGWVAEVTLGWAGFVDDATQNYLLAGGSVRRQPHAAREHRPRVRDHVQVGCGS